LLVKLAVADLALAENQGDPVRDARGGGFKKVSEHFLAQ